MLRVVPEHRRGTNREPRTANRESRTANREVLFTRADSNVFRVMPAVPGIHPQRFLDRYDSPVGMREGLAKIRLGQCAKKRNPGAMERIEEIDRHRNRRALRLW